MSLRNPTDHKMESCFVITEPVFNSDTKYDKIPYLSILMQFIFKISYFFFLLPPSFNYMSLSCYTVFGPEKVTRSSGYCTISFVLKSWKIWTIQAWSKSISSNRSRRPFCLTVGLLIKYKPKLCMMNLKISLVKVIISVCLFYWEFLAVSVLPFHRLAFNYVPVPEALKLPFPSDHPNDANFRPQIHFHKFLWSKI